MNKKGFFRPILREYPQIEALKLRNLRRETLNLIPVGMIRWTAAVAVNIAISKYHLYTPK